MRPVVEPTLIDFTSDVPKVECGLSFEDSARFVSFSLYRSSLAVPLDEHSIVVIGVDILLPCSNSRKYSSSATFFSAESCNFRYRKRTELLGILPPVKRQQNEHGHAFTKSI